MPDRRSEKLGEGDAQLGQAVAGRVETRGVWAHVATAKPKPPRDTRDWNMRTLRSLRGASPFTQPNSVDNLKRCQSAPLAPVTPGTLARRRGATKQKRAHRELSGF